MPLRYGVLRGEPGELLHHTPCDPTPHLEVLIHTPAGPWRLAINVRSDDLRFHAEHNFKHPVMIRLPGLPPGLTRPPREDRQLRLDYIRGNLFDRRAMRAAGSFGDSDALDTLLSEALAGVRETGGAELFAFGKAWGPEDDRPDEYFGFLPGRGITTST